ncbi:BTAD domain-containing putative transcriptional regulator, partial [Streptomyces sp. NPDC059340]|uniref:BTAD domain-containing putative transcriptional regulator n=1 Tax=Streptomyces sp. NPDC059340 TaxID=3346806 RepID=UPI0036B6B533
LSAAEERARLLLSLGRHERVAAELPPLAEEHPERERLVADSMLALHRSGRSADALRLYRSVRGTLRSAFDAEPGRAGGLPAAVLFVDAPVPSPRRA